MVCFQIELFLVIKFLPKFLSHDENDNNYVIIEIDFVVVVVEINKNYLLPLLFRCADVTVRQINSITT